MCLTSATTHAPVRVATSISSVGLTPGGCRCTQTKASARHSLAVDETVTLPALSLSVPTDAPTKDSSQLLGSHRALRHPDLGSEVPAKKVPQRRYSFESYSNSNCTC